MNSGTNQSGAIENEDARLAKTAVVRSTRQPTSVSTRMTFAAPPEKLWERLMFYEQIEKRPPLFLCLFLPVPIRTRGRKAKVGDEILCSYTRGHLRKRVTRVTRDKNYAFEIIEQNLTLGGGIKLSGGSYTLRRLPDGRAEVVVETQYFRTKRSYWLRTQIEAVVCHSFHRHILRAMRSNLP